MKVKKEMHGVQRLPQDAIKSSVFILVLLDGDDGN